MVIEFKFKNPFIARDRRFVYLTSVKYILNYSSRVCHVNIVL